MRVDANSVNISAPFIRRPIATALIMLGVVRAWPGMPIRSCPWRRLPNINYPTLTVTAQLPGADPQTMASSVASPLELQFGRDTRPHPDDVGERARLYTGHLQFDLSRQIDGAVSDTLSAINAATPYLPTGIPYPPLIRKGQPRRHADHWCSE